jgi:hypothetical protein
MNFIQYLLLLSVIINLYYLYNYISLFENFPFQNVIPETENDYPILTKQKLRGMGKEVNANVKANIIDTLIREHWDSIYKGVLLATGQNNVNSYTASLNCYQHLHFRNFQEAMSGRSPRDKLWNNKKYCHLFGSSLSMTNKEFLQLVNNIQFNIEKEFGPELLAAFYGNPWSAEGIMGAKTLYVPDRDNKFEEPTLTNINLAKRRIIQFKLNATEIEEIVETEIDKKIIETFPDVNITKTYSECCQKILLNW